MQQRMSFILVLFLLGCHTDTPPDCTLYLTKEIALPGGIQFSIPASWTKVDSTQYYDRALIYRRRFMNPDSSAFASVSIYDYGVYPHVQLDEKKSFQEMKIMMEGMNKRKNFSLLEDVSKEINGHTVNLLTYGKLSGNKKMYHAHIGFILQQRKQIEIEVSCDSSGEPDLGEVTDCIFSSLKIK